jgi:3-oxoacyl-[acyl-carrier protein] reductase
MTFAHLPERVAITGASGALGHALTSRCAQAGIRVAAFTHTRPAGPEAEWSTRADLTDAQSVQDAFARMELAWGIPEALIHCAGMGYNRLFARMGLPEQQQVLQTNLQSTLLTAHGILPAMIRSNRGHLIFLSSLAAAFPRPGQAVYAATKGGIESFTRALAREVAAKNIRVNALAPGFLDTPMVQSLPVQTREELLELIPLKRWGKVSEVAESVLFLLSSSSAYITGQIIRIDGGAGA